MEHKTPTFSADKIQRALELSPDTLVVLSPDGTIAWISAGVIALTGSATADHYGRDIASLAHPEDRQRLSAAVRALPAAEQITITYRTMHMLRGYVATEATFRPLDEPGDGIPPQVVGALRDISGRAHSAIVAPQDTKTAHLIVDSVVDYAIYMLDLDGTVRSWNAGAQRITGYSADEIIGSNFSVFFTEDDLRANVPMRSLLTARTTGRFETRAWRLRKEGSRLWAHVVIDAIRDSSGQVTGFAKITRDITQTAALSPVSEESGSIAQMLVDSVLDYAIYLLDLDGTVKSWNSGAQRIKGYSAEEIIGSNFSIFYTADDVRSGEPERSLAIARDTGRFEAEGWRVRKNGSRLRANVVIDAVRDLEGDVVGFAKITRDVTASAELRATSEQLRAESRQLLTEKAAAEKARRIATIAANHDPLTGLLNRRGIQSWITSQSQLAAILLYLDIDGFKSVNDRGGHKAGDDTLRQVAQILQGAVRESDRCARMGGDEFLVVIFGENARRTYKSVIERITLAIGTLCPLGPADTTRIGVSVGVAHITGSAALTDALREADADLYKRKSEHRAMRNTLEGPILPR